MSEALPKKSQNDRLADLSILDLHLKRFYKLQRFNCPSSVEGNLIIGLIRLQLHDGSLGIQDTALEKIHSREYLIVSDRTQNKIKIMFPGLTAVRHEIKPSLISTIEMADIPVRITQK